MPDAYEAIATTTLSGATVTVTFSGITQVYRDLIVVMETNGASASYPYTQMQFNNTGSSSLYDGPVASASSGTSAGGWWSGVNGDSFQFTYYNPGSSDMMIFQATILDYSVTDKSKTVLARQAGQNSQEFMTARFRSTASITSLKIFSWGSVGYNAGTRISLYGIRA